MSAFLQQYGFLLMMGLLLVFMMWFSSRSRKRMQAKEEERRRQVEEDLVPGTWVKTVAGFWGRFVDRDGDVVILETPAGAETYWDLRSIRDIGETPRFADDDDTEDASESEPDEPEQPILGLDAPTRNTDTQGPAVQLTDDDADPKNPKN